MDRDKFKAFVIADGQIILEILLNLTRQDIKALHFPNEGDNSRQIKRIRNEVIFDKIVSLCGYMGVTNLNLNGNWISDDGMISLFTMLKDNKTIKDFFLFSNKDKNQKLIELTPNTADVLSQSLKTNKTLKYLRLGSSDECTEIVAEGVKANYYLEKFAPIGNCKSDTLNKINNSVLFYCMANLPESLQKKHENKHILLNSNDLYYIHTDRKIEKIKINDLQKLSELLDKKLKDTESNESNEVEIRLTDEEINELITIDGVHTLPTMLRNVFLRKLLNDMDKEFKEMPEDFEADSNFIETTFNNILFLLKFSYEGSSDLFFHFINSIIPIHYLSAPEYEVALFIEKMNEENSVYSLDKIYDNTSFNFDLFLFAFAERLAVLPTGIDFCNDEKMALVLLLLKNNQLPDAINLRERFFTDFLYKNESWKSKKMMTYSEILNFENNSNKSPSFVRTNASKKRRSSNNAATGDRPLKKGKYNPTDSNLNPSQNVIIYEETISSTLHQKMNEKENSTETDTPNFFIFDLSTMDDNSISNLKTYAINVKEKMRILLKKLHQFLSIKDDLTDMQISQDPKPSQTISTFKPSFFAAKLKFRDETVATKLDILQPDDHLIQPPANNIIQIAEIKRKGLPRISKNELVKQIQMTPDHCLGESVDNGGCFFDALAQILNGMNKNNLHSEKYLRNLCHNFYLNEKELIDKWNNEDQGLEEGADYYFINYTQPELDTLPLNNRSVIWGRPLVEGAILCAQLGLEGIIIFELIDNPDKKSDQKFIVSAFLINASRKMHYFNDDYSTCFEDKYAKTPKLVVSGFHFIPIFHKMWQPDLSNNKGNSVSALTSNSATLFSANFIPIIPSSLNNINSNEKQNDITTNTTQYT